MAAISCCSSGCHRIVSLLEIRELQNLVERAAILSVEGVLPNPLHKKQTEVTPPHYQ